MKTPTNPLTRFTRSERGNVAISFGLMMIPICGIMGSAVDYGRWVHARSITRTAMDAAVLAGGRALQVNGGDVTAALAVAQRYYEQNTTTRMVVRSDTVAFKTQNANTQITADGNVSIDTPLLSIIGIEELYLLNDNAAEYSVATLATGGNATINLEVSLMLDITGSMEGSKLTDMQAAARDLINIVVLENQAEYTSKVALVPFSQAVNLGGTYFHAITNKYTTSTLSALDLPASQHAAAGGTLATVAASFWTDLALVQPAYADNGGNGNGGNGNGWSGNSGNGNGWSGNSGNGNGWNGNSGNGNGWNGNSGNGNGWNGNSGNGNGWNGNGWNGNGWNGNGWNGNGGNGNGGNGNGGNGNGGDDDDNNSGGGSSQNYGPCAVDREGNDALTDAAPGPGTYVQAYDIAKQVNSHTRDMACRPGAVTILPLSNDKSTLLAKIDSFTADGYTAGSVGTAFAWYMISPEWADIWPAASQPAAYNDPKTKKIAILMTDGEYNTWYNGNGNGDASAQAVALCAGMKEKGIEVYTVGFELGENATAVSTLSSCSSGASYAYIAENGDQLKQAFRDIAIKLSNLYLSK